MACERTFEEVTRLRAENQRLREKFVRVKEVWAKGWAAWELRKKSIDSMRSRHDQAIRDCMKAEADLQAARLTIASLEGRLAGKEEVLDYARERLDKGPSTCPCGLGHVTDGKHEPARKP